MADKKVTYEIVREYIGKDIWIKIPEYSRPDKGKFVMDDKLSQKDRKYLHELDYPYINKLG